MIHVAAPDVSANTLLLTSDRALLTPLADGTGVLLHLDTKFYYTLNATGSHIWRSLLAGLSVAEASRQLEATFEVTAQEAQQVTLALVQELADQSLVQPVAGRL